MMKISSTVWWILVSSLIIALIIMILSYLYTIFYVKKIRIKAAQANLTSIHNAYQKRKEHGVLLWDLKKQTKDKLNDFEVELMINTILRNNYKFFNIINYPNNYLKQTFIKLAKCQYDENKYDFLVFYDEKDLLNKFSFYLQKLSQNGMIIILETKKRNQKAINFLKNNHLKNIKYELTKNQNGMIFIVKI